MEKTCANIAMASRWQFRKKNNSKPCAVLYAISWPLTAWKPGEASTA